MSCPEDGWHLVCDPTGAREVMDPWGAEFGRQLLANTEKEDG